MSPESSALLPTSLLAALIFTSEGMSDVDKAEEEVTEGKKPLEVLLWKLASARGVRGEPVFQSSSLSAQDPTLATSAIGVSGASNVFVVVTLPSVRVDLASFPPDGDFDSNSVRSDNFASLLIAQLPYAVKIGFFTSRSEWPEA